jgi:hypothetical protein
MDKEFNSINELLSDDKDEQIRQDDIAWSCLEGELYGDQNKTEDRYLEHLYIDAKTNITYQESEYYNPFANSEE